MGRWYASTCLRLHPNTDTDMARAMDGLSKPRQARKVHGTAGHETSVSASISTIYQVHCIFCLLDNGCPASQHKSDAEQPLSYQITDIANKELPPLNSKGRVHSGHRQQTWSTAAAACPPLSSLSARHHPRDYLTRDQLVQPSPSGDGRSSRWSQASSPGAAYSSCSAGTSSSYSSSSSSTPASWYCWYSETRSFILDSASVNSISSMPSPVYQ